jgi:hypothetical protein
MDVTAKCIISGKYGFDLISSNRYAMIEVEARNGDLIKVNQVNGLRYKEIWGAVEQPRHEEHPIIDDQNKIIVLGREEKQSKRTICVIGK